jgi:sugar phosphate isomerase/epimerase
MNRKSFLQQTSLATAGMLLANTAWAGKTPETFGIQVYSVKEDMATKPWDTLKELASYGYKKIESFEGKDGMFWGKTNKEFKKYVEGLGMKVVSSHCNINDNFETKAQQAAEIGMQYLICPWLGPQKTIADFKRFAKQFNECGKICKKYGLRFAYHNHDYSFKTLDGQVPQDVLMNETDASLVDFELDIYWIVTAGVNPITYMSKYKNRFRLAHIKDRTKNATEQGDTCNLGAGQIDYATIIPQAKKLGLQHLLVEQEKFANSTPMLSAKANATYMKKILV